MKRQFRFNKRSIDALPPCPADAGSKEVEYSDLEISGLRLQVNRMGRKFFLFRYQIGGRKREGLGAGTWRERHVAAFEGEAGRGG